MSPLLRGIYESPGGSESLDVLMKYMCVDAASFLPRRKLNSATN